MRPFQKIVKQTKILILMIILFILVLPVILFLVLIFYPLRSIVWLLSRFRSDLYGLVTNVHCVLATQFSSQADLNLITCGTFEGNIPVEYVRKCFDERVMNYEQNGKFPYDGLKRTWTSFLGYAFWQIDKDFDLKNHIRRYDYEGALAVPSPCTQNDLNKIFAGLLRAPWDRRKSPWECLVIENFRRSEEEKPQTVFIVRYDHILGDAYGLSEEVRLLTKASFKYPEIKMGDTARIPLWKKIRMLLKLPYDTAANLYPGLGAALIGGKQGSEKSDLIVSVSPTVNVELVKKIKEHFKVPYAAVLYAAILGAIEKAMRMSGQTVPDTLFSAFVLPRPNHPKGLNIHLAVIFAEWPIKCHSAVDRMLKIQKNFANLSQSTAALTYLFVANIAAFLPIRLRKMAKDLVTKIIHVSVGCTNFPTTMGTEHFDGHEILDIVVPLGTLFSAGLITTTGGLNNRQHFNFTVDKNLFASEEAAANLGLYVVQELHNLYEATV